MMQGAAVLVVDDDRLIRLLLRRMLQSAGLCVHEADCGSMAIERVRAEPPSLVLLDYHLPDLDGPTIARELRRQMGPEVPILMLTASQEERHIAEAFAAGADDYVNKPIDALLVMNRVRALLRIPSSPALPVRVGDWTIRAQGCPLPRYDLLTLGATTLLCATDAQAPPLPLFASRSLEAAGALWRTRCSVDPERGAVGLAAIEFGARSLSMLAAGMAVSLVREGTALLSISGDKQQPIVRTCAVRPGDSVQIGESIRALLA